MCPAACDSGCLAACLRSALPPVQKITGGALWLELVAMAILGATCLAWQFFSEQDGSSPFYY